MIENAYDANLRLTEHFMQISLVNESDINKQLLLTPLECLQIQKVLNDLTKIERLAKRLKRENINSSETKEK